jgi:hypothetical protein
MANHSINLHIENNPKHRQTAQGIKLLAQTHKYKYVLQFCQTVPEFQKLFFKRMQTKPIE